MTRLYIFADEAGCLTFERKPNVSRFFVLCTVKMTDCSVGAALSELRRTLAWEKAPLQDYFHASSEKLEVRRKVFDLLATQSFSVQFTVMEKAKAQPQIRKTAARFYQYGWFYHFKHGISKSIAADCEMLVTAAAIGNKKERIAFTESISDVLLQHMPPERWRTDFPPAAADPCVQVADYCAWAIQRKWEKQDDHAFRLIEPKVSYHYDLFAKGNHLFY